MLGKIIAGVAFTVVGSSAVLAGSACNYPNDFICAETDSATARLNCKDGVVVDKCEKGFGTCLIKTQGVEVNVRFYTGYATDAKADCDEAKGTYTAN